MSEAEAKPADAKPAEAKPRGLKRLGDFFDRVTEFLGNHQGFSRAWGLFLLVVFLGLCLSYIRFLDAPRGGAQRVATESLDTPRGDAPMVVPQSVDAPRRGAQMVPRHCSTLLALLPSLVALGHFAARRRRSVSHYTAALNEYLKFREEIAHKHYKGSAVPSKLLEQSDHDKKEFDHLLRPRGGQYLLGAVMLALPFLLVAAMSDVIHGLVEPPSPSYMNFPFQEGLRGLVFTGYGIFVYTLVVLLHRMHAGALSAEFLMSASLRVTTMMLIGFMVGEMDLFSQQRESFAPTSTGGASTLGGDISLLAVFVYFAIGAFPFWGYEALRARARKVLQPSIAAEKLPLEYVDGLDEMIIERLEELGITNAQHLATVDPVFLTLRTTYPLFRVVDWIDQAILITHLRGQTVIARGLGIRGAMDLRKAYKTAMEVPPPPRRFRWWRGGRSKPSALPEPVTRARALLVALASGTGTGIERIYTVGERLMDDFRVALLACLWHGQEPALDVF